MSQPHSRAELKYMDEVPRQLDRIANALEALLELIDEELSDE